MNKYSPSTRQIDIIEETNQQLKNIYDKNIQELKELAVFVHTKHVKGAVPGNPETEKYRLIWDHLHQRMDDYNYKISQL